MPLPDAPAEPSAADLKQFRTFIDEIDRRLLILLNERSQCANVIGHIKKQLRLPVYVPSREQEVLQNVTNSNEGPLENDAVQRLFERIIDETRALERKKYQDNLAG